MKRIWIIAVLGALLVGACGPKNESGFDNKVATPPEDRGAGAAPSTAPEAGAAPGAAAPGGARPEGDGNFREGAGVPN